MTFIDLIYPKKCLGCSREGHYLCSFCLANMPNIVPICPKCQKLSMKGATHLACKDPYGLDGLISLWPYKGVIRKAIMVLKYKFATEIAYELAANGVFSLKDLNCSLRINKSCFLVPIPLHRQKVNWRGFNQAEEVGKYLSLGLGLRFLPDLLLKKRLTVSQTGLNRSQRAENIHNVFVLNPKCKSLNPKDKVILFDDVYTTGATISEACKVLKRHGFKVVWGLTLAR